MIEELKEADCEELLHSSGSGDQQQSTVAEKLLAHGITQAYLPDLQKIQKSLDEVVKSQDCLTETLGQENRRFSEGLEEANIQQMISQIKVYQNKLMGAKKDMTSITDKSAKLKKRAEKLQQIKQKEALQRETQRAKEEEKEKQLVAQVAKNHKTS